MLVLAACLLASAYVQTQSGGMPHLMLPAGVCLMPRCLLSRHWAWGVEVSLTLKGSGGMARPAVCVPVSGEAGTGTPQ